MTLEIALLDSVRLTEAAGVGPATFQALLSRFGSATAVFAAAPSELRTVPGVGPKTLAGIRAAPDRETIARNLAELSERNVRFLVPGAASYPPNLAKIPDPPGVLYVRGEVTPADTLAVAIVGTRHPTPYGLRVAERLGSALAAAGYTIVSGLARGIDTAAHRGALQVGGRTLAVLGSGVLHIYPPENVGLAEEIMKRGAILGELPPTAPPVGHAFPQRNRIVTGLSLGVLVVEADRNSGALISARHAVEQNREVFAVPGPIESNASRGCHALLRDGAKLVECVEDLIENLGPLAEPIRKPSGETIRNPAELQLNEIEASVLNAVPVEHTSIDDVIAASGLAAHRVLAVLSVLEMRRLIRRVSGNVVCRI